MAFIDEYHGISKDEAVEKLVRDGYRAFNEKGVVKIGLHPSDTAGQKKIIENRLKEMDYRMSYGFFVSQRGMEGVPSGGC